MKIMHVAKKYPNALGGDAIVVANLEEQQRKLGHEVFILTSNCEEIENKEGLIKFGLKEDSNKLDQISLKRILSLIILFFKAYNLISKVKPDIVHSHAIDIGASLYFVCWLKNIPIINTFHGGLFSTNNRDLKRKFLEKILLKFLKFDKIISPNIKDVSKNVNYIPNGIKLTNQRNFQKRDRKFSILYIGRIDKQKGLDFLISAISVLKENVILKIIGAGKDLEYFKRKVINLGLQKKIVFFGPKNNAELSNYYSNADIFILPSLDEAFPVALLESWNYGLPIIITDVGGVSKLVKRNYNAILIPKKDFLEIKKSIIKLINNPALRKKLATNGLKEVKKYSWDKIIEQTEDVYNQVLKQKHETKK